MKKYLVIYTHQWDEHMVTEWNQEMKEFDSKSCAEGFVEFVKKLKSGKGHWRYTNITLFKKL